MVGLLIDEPPCPNYVRVLEEMETATQQTRPIQLMLPRGTGKTSAAEMLLLYLIATGRRKFVVIVSNNARSAGTILRDLWRPLIDKSDFSTDFPEVCAPFRACNGACRRR